MRAAMPGKHLREGFVEPEYAALGEARDHGCGHRLGVGAEVPAVIGADRLLGARLPHADGCAGLYLSADLNHRGNGGQVRLVTRGGERLREEVLQRGVRMRRNCRYQQHTGKE